MLRVVSHTVKEWGSWLEGCPCHEHIWKSSDSLARRQKRFFEETGLRTCMRKGCRGPEMAAFAVDMWLNRLRTCGSDALTLHCCKLAREHRACLIAKLQSMRELLCEEFSAKFEMWEHLPYLLLGLACADVAMAKNCASRAKSECTACDQPRAHRVTQIFFTDPVVVAEIDHFCASGEPLRHYPALYNRVTSYSLISLVERAIEGEHAKIEHVLTPSMLPATVCARIRSRYLIGLLDQPAFFAWCRRNWATHVFRPVLQSIRHASSMRGWTSERCLQNIYLYGIDEQFAEIKYEYEGTILWDQTVMKVLKPVRVATKPVAALCLDWLKHRLIPGRLFALPHRLARMVDYAGYRACPDVSDSDLVDVLSIVGCDEVISEPFNATKLVFFKVVNSEPNARVLQHPWHLGGRPQILRVVTYGLAQYREDSATAMLAADSLARCLDLQYLCSGVFSEVLQSLWLFGSAAPGAVMVVKDDA